MAELLASIYGTGTPDYEALLPNRMFRNNGGKSFQDVTTSGGFGQLQKGHAISFADFNRDGNERSLVTAMWTLCWRISAMPTIGSV